MDDIIITRDKDGGIAYLTTASPQSHYGVPVLRIEGAKDIPDRGIDYGPADVIVVADGRVIKGAHIIAAWAMGKKRTPQEVELARLYLSQWPDGPQVPHISAASTLGRKGGLSKSLAKSAASRENGKLGGRPKKSDARTGREENER